MPLAPVDDKGTVLYYEDTGVPNGAATYLTLVLVHGAMFNGAIFRPMFPFAPQHNLRIVTINKRDYAGSTPFSPEELDALRGPIEKQNELLATLGVQLGRFIAWFIQKEMIPLLSIGVDGTRSGGFALAGWSAGNIITFAFMGNADKLPEGTRNLLEQYYHTFIVYDMPSRAAGRIQDQRIYSPWRNPALSAEDRVNEFGTWVSTYYTPVATLTGDGGLIGARTALLEPGTDRVAKTVARMTPEELAVVEDKPAFVRSQLFVLTVDPRVQQENVRRAILDARFDVGGEMKVIWPVLQVKAIWCDMTMGDIIAWTQELLDSWNTERQHEHGGARPFEVYKLENANHFPHWEDAQRFTGFVAKILGSAIW